MNEAQDRVNPQVFRTLKLIAEKLAGAKSGSTAALYGLPAGDDTIRQALRRCNELHAAINANARLEQSKATIEQLQADIRASAALGAISGKELQDTYNLIDDLWEQIGRET